MKTVCKECNGDLKEITSFKTKVSSWGEMLTAWVSLYQCQKCKTIFSKET